MEYWNSLTFASPNAFWLLILPGLMVLWQVWRYKQLYPTLRLPILDAVKGHTHPVRGFIKKYLFVLRAAAVALLVIALARPQQQYSDENVDTEGIDIMLALDVSGSMEAMDFSPDRLGAAKEKAREFVERRPNDRMGLVVFAGESFTQCPLTTDHAMLKKLLMEVEGGLLETGTAIGMGLSTSVIRLRDSDAKSRVVILLTDGVNNAGFIDPITAVDAALEYGIRVYTIGVGKNGEAPFLRPTLGGMRQQYMEVKLDEALLKDIAKKTGGKYFQATNNEALGKVYEEIDELEKTKIQVTRITRKTEEFHWFLIIGGLLFMLELLLRYAVVRNIP